MTGEAVRRARDCPLAIVTGAPGAGKSAAVAAILQLPRDYLVFDADHLLPDLSALAGRAIRNAADLWPPYRRLWLTIARLVGQNGRPTALFIPIEPRELAASLPGDWDGPITWCLLDCDDATRRARLLARGWDSPVIAEAIDDARALRDQTPFAIDSGHLPTGEAATTIDRWLRGRDGVAGAAAAPEEVVADVL